MDPHDLTSFLHDLYTRLRAYCIAEPGVIHRIPADTAPLSDPISVTRVLCGAMILPTIATIVGKIMFGKVESNFQRTLMVGIMLLSSVVR